MGEKPRVSAFIGGARLFHAQRKIGRHPDLARTGKYIEGSGEVTNCMSCAGPIDEQPQQKPRDMLSHDGFPLERKLLETIFQEDGSTIRKANLDIERVLDMLDLIGTCDLAVVATGDRDFERPSKPLRARGKRTRVVSNPGMIAAGLRGAARPRLIDRNDLEAQLQRGE